MTSRPIPRKSVTTEQIANAGKLVIRHYNRSNENQPSLVYKELKDLKVQDSFAHLDLLYKLTQPLIRSPRPAWSGTMQMIFKGDHPMKSSVQFLPMIDMDPSNLTCIYSTLSFIVDQAKRYNLIPIITFDQPLWWKALLIVLNEPGDSDMKSIVLRLGGLHIQMSFLGCIGHIMAGSGLQDVLELVYAKNAVVHMLSGKAIARAIRGHFLVDSALNCLLMRYVFNLPYQVNGVSGNNEEAEDGSSIEEIGEQVPATTFDDDLKQADLLFKRLLLEEVNINEVDSAEILTRLSEEVENKKRSMENQRTAVLWMQYMKMIDILRMFIKAERTGNWNLHLQAVYDMLPYFAAAGHNMYAKSAYIYLQLMEDLKDKHPDVYQQFQDGLHVVRRSDRYWAGLSTDLVIEQVLMRSVKTTGGLTRGKGMTEIQRLVWLLSMPSCAEINIAMQSLTGNNYVTSEQHKDCSEARQERDFKDMTQITDYLYERNPFGPDSSLRNIVSGAVADANVNADQAEEVGRDIIATMVDKNVQEFTFRKKDQVATLASKGAVTFSDGNIQVDPQLLFQRLSVVAACGRHENSQELFKFEMCGFPPALFESTFLPRQTNKPALANAIWERTKELQTSQPSADVNYVIDGGSLLHHLPWPRDSTYDTVFSLGVQYITRKYGQATIVFDGYEDGPSTKDCTHLRRAGAGSPTIKFEGHMVMSSKKQDFLANKTNKQRFINMFANKLQAAGCTVFHATGDADVLIVTTAVESAKTKTTVLIGEDTDLLILLCYHADPDGEDLFFMGEPKKASISAKMWNIKRAKFSLGKDVCTNILFLHTILGCDTTSRIHGIGKGGALKHFEVNTIFRQQASVFMDPESTQQDVILAGERSIICLYGGKADDSLDVLRYTRFCQKVASGSSLLQPENLPPTSSAAAFHSKRVYYQVQEWKGNHELLPLDWGWKLHDGKLLPVTTDLPAAHESLLQMIRCNCKTDCKTMRCTCKKHGLDCSPACGICKGQTCLNSSPPDLTPEDD